MDSSLPRWLAELETNPDNIDPVSGLPMWLARLDVADELVNGLPRWLAELADEGDKDK